MLTKFGKILRKLRIEHEEVLKNMADKMKITSAYLSAIECGKRDIPNWMIERLEKNYNLTREEVDELEKAKDLSLKSYVIEFDNISDEQKELVLKFARTFKNIDKDNMERLQKFFIELNINNGGN